jgi:hypothetical protein
MVHMEIVCAGMSYVADVLSLCMTWLELGRLSAQAVCADAIELLSAAAAVAEAEQCMSKGRCMHMQLQYSRGSSCMQH